MAFFSFKKKKNRKVKIRFDAILAFLALSLCYSFFQSSGGFEQRVQELKPALAYMLEEAKAQDGDLMQESSSTVTTMLPAAKDSKKLRFLMLNARRYFVPADTQRSRYAKPPKPEHARQAVAEVIASASPDMVGLIEMGGAASMQELRKRLSLLGEDYPYSAVLEPSHSDLSIGLLSKHPIIKDNSQAQYKLFGNQRRRMLRGIFDVLVEVEDGRQFRFVGVHLKSRLSRDAAAAASLRSREARTLAMYLQKTMRQQAKLPLLVFGDWNDNPNDASVKILTQGISADSALTRLDPLDSHGLAWTIYYARGRSYHTFDQIYINDVLKERRRKARKSGIVDIPATKTASDHRAVWCELR